MITFIIGVVVGGFFGILTLALIVGGSDRKKK
mgnify:CR=1 FL=1